MISPPQAQMIYTSFVQSLPRNACVLGSRISIAILSIGIASHALAQSGPTISPSKGGIACKSWEWRYYNVIDIAKCGLWGPRGGAPGLARNRVYTGKDCTERDSEHKVIKSFYYYNVPRSAEFVQCVNG